MKNIDSFIIAGVIILIFMGGYYAGLSESEAGKYVLKMSQWEEIHAYRACMYDPTCKMYVKVKK